MQIKEARLIAEDEKFAKYKVKLKAVSLFFVIFSVFILLNASIGASSAPFYDKDTTCSKYEPTEQCKELAGFTSALYCLEVTGSIILSVHGVLGMTLREHIKKTCLIRFLNIYTRAALLIYALDALLRTAMYFKIKRLLVPVEEEPYKLHFGGYLAVYCEKEVLGVVITAVLLGVYACCFCSTCFMWRLTNQLYATATTVGNEESEDSVGKRGPLATDPTETDAAAFADFDNNTKRIQKASQVILSINEQRDQEDFFDRD